MHRKLEHPESSCPRCLWDWPTNRSTRMFCDVSETTCTMSLRSLRISSVRLGSSAELHERTCSKMIFRPMQSWHACCSCAVGPSWPAYESNVRLNFPFRPVNMFHVLPPRESCRTASAAGASVRLDVNLRLRSLTSLWQDAEAAPVTLALHASGKC